MWHVAFSEPSSKYPPVWHEVIGIVPDVRSPLSEGGWDRPAADAPLGRDFAWTLAVRGPGTPRDLIAGLRTILADADPSIVIYGVVSHSVAQRLREIGVRIALGAARGDIIRLIASEGGRTAAVGIALGIAIGYAAVRLARQYVMALPSLDVFTLVGAPIVIGVIVLVACYIPARRGARVDPMVALRDL